VGEKGKPDKRSARVQLPNFVSDEDIGLGDLVSRVTRSVVHRPCQGCERRAEMLNGWLQFHGRRGGSS
jgi:hypothetical protein